MYEYRATISRVVDGDTVDAVVDLGFFMTAHIRFRVYGIDTPEIRGKEKVEGLKAKQQVVDWIEGKTVVIRTEKTGKFGRWLARILFQEKEDGPVRDLTDSLISLGLGKPYYGGRKK